jgi:hypothetical protein
VTVELLACDTRLDRDVEIVDIDRKDSVHAREVDAQATVYGQHLAFD